MENKKSNQANTGKTLCALSECRMKGYFCNTCKRRCDGYFEAKGEKSQCLDATKICAMVLGKGDFTIFHITHEEAERLISENRVAYAGIEINQEDINKYLFDKKDGAGKSYQFQIFFGVYDDENEKGEEN